VTKYIFKLKPWSHFTNVVVAFLDSLNGKERGQNFDNTRHKSQNGENTSVALAEAGVA